jgi:CheY-like chemotaxis protein
VGSAAIFADVRICVVDDNRNFQNLFRTLLRGMGFRRVDVHGDPLEALALVNSTPIDITFVDLVMPRQNGIDWTRSARRSSGLANPTMPITLVSGHVDRRVLEAAVKAGVDDVLVKPLSPATLYRHISRLLRHPVPYVRGPEGYFGPDLRSARNRPAAADPVAGGPAHMEGSEAGRRRYARTVPGLHVERPREPVYDVDQAFLD